MALELLTATRLSFFAFFRCDTDRLITTLSRLGPRIRLTRVFCCLIGVTLLFRLLSLLVSFRRAYRLVLMLLECFIKVERAPNGSTDWLLLAYP